MWIFFFHESLYLKPSTTQAARTPVNVIDLAIYKYKYIYIYIYICVCVYIYIYIYILLPIVRS